MSVFLVITGDGTEGDPYDVESVWNTKKKAKRRAENIRREDSRIAEVTEWTVLTELEELVPKHKTRSRRKAPKGTVERLIQDSMDEMGKQSMENIAKDLEKHEAILKAMKSPTNSFRA